MGEGEHGFELRTDLALEQRERFVGRGGEIAGVALDESVGTLTANQK